MNTDPFFSNTPETNHQPSKALKIITMLSIIGNILGLFSSVSNYFKAKANYEEIKNMLDNGAIDKAPAFVKWMINEDSLKLADLMLQNRIPVMITSLIGAILCLVGAIEMRKLKLQGYTFWLIGELLPIVSMAIFIGALAFKGYLLIGYLFPLLFIVLYTKYKKELVK